MQNFSALFLALFFTLISGAWDAKGFIHISRVWNDGRFVWREALYSLLCLQGGIVAFWFAVRYLHQLHVRAAEVQTLFWFGVTIIGVAVLSRQFVT